MRTVPDMEADFTFNNLLIQRRHYIRNHAGFIEDLKYGQRIIKGKIASLWIAP